MKKLLYALYYAFEYIRKKLGKEYNYKESKNGHDFQFLTSSFKSLDLYLFYQNNYYDIMPMDQS